jgi:hypothetical protein
MGNYSRTPQTPTGKGKSNKNGVKSERGPQKCGICHNEEVIWTMQPDGPGEDIIFAFPGSHYRGFMAVNVCDTCHDVVLRGERVVFTYRGIRYAIEQRTLKPLP